MYERLRTLLGCSAWWVWKGASARGDLCLGLSWGVDSGVAMTEAIRMERHKEEATVHQVQIGVRTVAVLLLIAVSWSSYFVLALRSR